VFTSFKKVASCFIIFSVSLIFYFPSVEACAPKQVREDTVTPALLAGDATAVIEGCGNQPIVGYTYCRIVEGSADNQFLSVIGPPALCNQDSCVFLKFYDNQGKLSWGGSIPKGQTRVSISWATLLGCLPGASCSFNLGQRGFWSFTQEVHWVDTASQDRVSVSTGDITLRIVQRGYSPLNTVENDSNFVWSWKDQGFIYQMTTGLRAYVGRIRGG
jgi:hypothetical protein